MHPYISQSLINVMIADRHQRAAADRRAREARATARTASSRAARKRQVVHQPVPIETAVPVQRLAVTTARSARVASAGRPESGAVSVRHGATAVEVEEAPQMCGAAR
jgi:hypothetical protein